METAREELLTGSCLAHEQEIDRQRTQRFQLTSQFLHAGRRTNQSTAWTGAAGKTFPQIQVFRLQASHLCRPRQDVEKQLRFAWLFQEVVSAGAHGAHGAGYVTLAGDHEAGEGGRVRLDGSRELKPRA